MKKKLNLILICIAILVLAEGFTKKNISAPAVVEIAIIVNKDNPLTTLTTGEVKLYFLRKIKKRWVETNKNIRPVDRKTKCVEQDIFYSKVLNMGADDVEKYFVSRQYQNAEKPQDKFASDKEIIGFVGEEVGAIGYVNSASLIPEALGKVKVVLRIN